MKKVLLLLGVLLAFSISAKAQITRTGEDL